LPVVGGGGDHRRLYLNSLTQPLFEEQEEEEERDPLALAAAIRRRYLYMYIVVVADISQ
jgi:hypothetical protein